MNSETSLSLYSDVKLYTHSDVSKAVDTCRASAVYTRFMAAMYVELLR